jgi:hypothetical protein
MPKRRRVCTRRTPQGFDAGLDANEVFSQWISVLPTDQIVAVAYEPTDLLVP